MEPRLRFDGAVTRDPAVAAWFAEHTDALGAIASSWFARIRDCGEDVVELMHDGQPTACLRDVPFAYVAAFTKHVNVGFFMGAFLPDPLGLLEGAGKRMRHVKLYPGVEINADGLVNLVRAAYRDARDFIAAEQSRS